MATMSPYCKAYYLKDLRRFDGWRETQPRGDDDYLFLHDSLVVTDGIFSDEQIVFDEVTPAWRAFCETELGFAVPDVIPAEANGAAASAAAGQTSNATPDAAPGAV